MRRRDLLASLGLVAAGGVTVNLTLGGEGEPPSDQPANATATPTATATAAPTQTATPAFEPAISFPTCTTVAVDHEQFTYVALVFADGVSQDFQGQWGGTQTFAGTGQHEGKVIQEVLVGDGSGTASTTNPAVETCTATATPEAADASAETQTTTTTEQATETPTTTETETPTPTATPEPAQNVSVSFFKIQNTAVPGTLYDVEANNDNSYSVRVQVSGYWNWKNGSRDTNTETYVVGAYDISEETFGTGAGPDDETLTDHDVWVDSITKA